MEFGSCAGGHFCACRVRVAECSGGHEETDRCAPRQPPPRGFCGVSIGAMQRMRPHLEQEETEGTEGEALAEIEGLPGLWQNAKTLDLKDAKAEGKMGSVFKSVLPPPSFSWQCGKTLRSRDL